MSKSEDPLDESMTVARTATCDTLTRKSKLTYQIGTLPDGEVYLRIHKNTGNGLFSREWIALSDIAREYALHYHLLREYMVEHPEVGEIPGAMD
ncbi:MAG: hypothetical protein EP297_00240 [Gammaproteobacteria bacterium]|nr:MAG: hypothetical protein EP297_00240 [Gammaproteobacteria bacterium]